MTTDQKLRELILQLSPAQKLDFINYLVSLTGKEYPYGTTSQTKRKSPLAQA